MINKIKGYLEKKVVGAVVKQAIDELNYDTFNDLIDVIKDRRTEIVTLAEIHSDDIINLYNKIKESK